MPHNYPEHNGDVDDLIGPLDWDDWIFETEDDDDNTAH